MPVRNGPEERQMDVQCPRSAKHISAEMKGGWESNTFAVYDIIFTVFLLYFMSSVNFELMTVG